MLKKTFCFPFHPLLFAAGYVFTQFNLHSDIYAVSDIWTPLVVLTGITGVVLWLWRFWTPDLHAAAVWVAAWCVGLTFMWNSAGGNDAVPNLIALWIITSALGVLAKRMAALGERATRSLNIFAAIFLLAQTSMIIIDRYMVPKLPVLETTNAFLTTTPPNANSSVPNVFHIVMDAYSRDDVLQSVYGFDNAPFLNTLKELGFHIFADAHAPFNQTLLTMSSVFSGAYLDQEKLQRQYREARQVRQSLGRFLDVGAVPLWLRGLGYHLSMSSTGYLFLRAFHVDRWERLPRGETNLFALALYERSPMGWLDQQRLGGAGRHLMFQRTGSATYLNDLVRYVLPLGAPTDFPSPYLVYRHVLAPHPPFTLDHSGADIESDQFSTIMDGDFVHQHIPKLQQAYIRGYVEKLSFANRELLVGLQRIIKETRHPFVIFLHGDHGGGAYMNYNSLTRTCPKERFSVFMAVYASSPELQHDLVNSLKKTPNPVNFYRALYNAIHKTNHPMLPDYSQFAARNTPWIFTPVPPEALNTECSMKE